MIEFLKNFFGEKYLLYVEGNNYINLENANVIIPLEGRKCLIDEEKNEIAQSYIRQVNSLKEKIKSGEIKKTDAHETMINRVEKARLIIVDSVKIVFSQNDILILNIDNKKQFKKIVKYLRKKIIL